MIAMALANRRAWFAARAPVRWGLGNIRERVGPQSCREGPAPIRGRSRTRRDPVGDGKLAGLGVARGGE